MITMTSAEQSMYDLALESIATSYCKWWMAYTDLRKGNYESEDEQRMLTRDMGREWEAKRDLTYHMFSDCFVMDGASLIFEHMEPIAKRMLKDMGIAY